MKAAFVPKENEPQEDVGPWPRAPLGPRDPEITPRGGPPAWPPPHPAPGPDMEVHQPTRLAPGPFPQGVFSKPATFLRGFTRDPPHPQLGGSHCLLPPPPGKATPYVLCF